MKTASSTLIALLSSQRMLPFADCFTLLPISGDVLRYTNLDVPVWADGNYFAANAVRIQGLKYKCSVGVDIDEQDITLIATGSDLIGGVPFLQAMREGVFDGATIQRYRAFFDPDSAWPPDPLNGAVATGTVMLFSGRVADIRAIGNTTADINVKSGLVLLDIDFPRNLWQASCLHTLYDSGCGLSKAAYTHTGSVLAGATFNQVPFSAGGTGATVTAVMSGTAGAPIAAAMLTSSAAANASYTSEPTITISDPTGSGAVLKALAAPNIYSGGWGFYGIAVISGGTGYTNPTITITGGGGAGGSAQAILGAGSMTLEGVHVSGGGSGYSPATQFELTGGGGQGAAVSPIVTGGAVIGGNVTTGGSGYYAAPAITVVDDAGVNYAQGTILFASGANAGVLRQIKSAASGILVLIDALDYLPVAGDVFQIWPGCDHTRGAGGCAKFNNLANFRGFPFVPPPETAY